MNPANATTPEERVQLQDAIYALLLAAAATKSSRPKVIDLANALNVNSERVKRALQALEIRGLLRTVGVGAATQFEITTRTGEKLRTRPDSWVWRHMDSQGRAA